MYAPDLRRSPGRLGLAFGGAHGATVFTDGVWCVSPGYVSAGRARIVPMSMELSFKLGASARQWLTLRGNTNPLSATGGPLPRVTIPLEARVTADGIEIRILRLAFDLKLGSTLVGQGEIGPCTYLCADYGYLPVTATCPRDALPYLLNPPPPQGRITLTLGLKGLLFYRHSYQPGVRRRSGCP